MKLYVINGPNLNMLGKREPELYGSKTLSEIENELGLLGAKLGLDLKCFQSNFEGEIVSLIQSGETDASGVILNAAAVYTYKYRNQRRRSVLRCACGRGTSYQSPWKRVIQAPFVIIGCLRRGNCRIWLAIILPGAGMVCELL